MCKFYQVLNKKPKTLRIHEEMTIEVDQSILFGKGVKLVLRRHTNPKPGQFHFYFQAFNKSLTSRAYSLNEVFMPSPETGIKVTPCYIEQPNKYNAKVLLFIQYTKSLTDILPTAS